MKTTAKNMKAFYAALIIFLIAPMAWLQAATFVPAIDAEVNKHAITIGEIIKYKVNIQLPADAQLKTPITRQEKLGEFIIRDFKQSTTKGKQQGIVLNYALTIFQPGEYKIPDYSVSYRNSPEEDWQELSTASVAITVKSVLKDKEPAALKPLKPKLIIWQEFIGWIIGSVFLIALIAVLIAAWQRKKTQQLAKPQIEPAHVIAYRELEELQKLNLPARGFMEEYFQRLSGCIRHYLENRFNLRAPWMSTEEFLQEAKTSLLLIPRQRVLLKDFLGLSDMVKFARYGASTQEAENYFFAARNFIDQTKQIQPEQEPDVQ